MNDPCEGKYDIVLRLRDHINRDDNDIAEAAAYIERLRKERDEARREVCELRCNPPEPFIGLPHELAKINGWDCYGVTNGQHLRTSVAESSQEAP